MIPFVSPHVKLAGRSATSMYVWGRGSVIRSPLVKVAGKHNTPQGYESFVHAPASHSEELASYIADLSTENLK